MAESDSNMQQFLESRKIDLGTMGQVAAPATGETTAQRAKRQRDIAIKKRVSFAIPVTDLYLHFRSLKRTLWRLRITSMQTLLRITLFSKTCMTSASLSAVRRLILGTWLTMKAFASVTAGISSTTGTQDSRNSPVTPLSEPTSTWPWNWRRTSRSSDFPHPLPWPLI